MQRWVILSCLLFGAATITSDAAKKPGDRNGAPSWIAAVNEIREADAVVIARVADVKKSPGIWCGIMRTWQEVDWNVERTLAGQALDGIVRVRHLLVGPSALVADEPRLRDDVVFRGRRMVVTLRREKAGENEESAWLATFAEPIDGSLEEDQPLATILQAILDHPQLSPWRDPSRPNAAVEYVVSTASVDHPLALKWMGRPIGLLPIDAPQDLNVVRFHVERPNGHEIRVKAEIPREGVVIDAKALHRGDRWTIDSLSVAERK